MGGVGQTQAQSSLYERLLDRVNEIEENNEEELDNLRNRFEDNQMAEDRIDDAQERANERFDGARDRLNNAVENNNVDLLTGSVFDKEEDNDDYDTLAETPLLRPEDNGQSDSNSNSDAAVMI